MVGKSKTFKLKHTHPHSGPLKLVSRVKCFGLVEEGQWHCLHGPFHDVLNPNHLISHQNHQHQPHSSDSLFKQLFENDKRPINSWKAPNLFRLTWELLVSIPNTEEWVQCFCVFMPLTCPELFHFCKTFYDKLKHPGLVLLCELTLNVMFKKVGLEKCKGLAWLLCRWLPAKKHIDIMLQIFFHGNNGSCFQATTKNVLWIENKRSHSRLFDV